MRKKPQHNTGAFAPKGPNVPNSGDTSPRKFYIIDNLLSAENIASRRADY